MRPQARAARASELAVSTQAAKIFQAPPGGPAQSIFLGWARPIYINRHPQPPAKDIGFSEISQITNCYRNNKVDGYRDLGYSGI